VCEGGALCSAHEQAGTRKTHLCSGGVDGSYNVVRAAATRLRQRQHGGSYRQPAAIARECNQAASLGRNHCVRHDGAAGAGAGGAGAAGAAGVAAVLLCCVDVAEHEPQVEQERVNLVGGQQPALQLTETVDLL
jgi:hypothetical protein